MSVREVQQSVIVLLSVLILMEAMSVHARLDSQEMDLYALVQTFTCVYMYAYTHISTNHLHFKLHSMSQQHVTIIYWCIFC